MKGLLVGLLLVIGLVAPAMAAPEDVANAIAAEIMSPFCDGVTLHDCPSQQAEDLRVRIQTWAEQGLSRGQIMDRLEARYGSRIHATPEPEGLGLLAWALPLGVTVAGVALAGVLARRWVAARDAERARVRGVPVSAEERERLEAELHALEARG